MEDGASGVIHGDELGFSFFGNLATKHDYMIFKITVLPFEVEKRELPHPGNERKPKEGSEVLVGLFGQRGFVCLNLLVGEHLRFFVVELWNIEVEL